METGKPMSLFQETSWEDQVKKPTKPPKTCETLKLLPPGIYALVKKLLLLKNKF